MIRARAKREIVIGYKNFSMTKPEVNPKNKDDRVLNVDDTAALVVMALGLPPWPVWLTTAGLLTFLST